MKQDINCHRKIKKKTTTTNVFVVTQDFDFCCLEFQTVTVGNAYTVSEVAISLIDCISVKQKEFQCRFVWHHKS